MRVAVVGAGCAVGRAVVPWLRREGHQVIDVPVPSAEVEQLAAAVAGCDAVLHLAGAAARLSGRWRHRGHPRHPDRTSRLVRAAEVAGVHRVVATSSSLLYADNGDDWITEESALCVTSATEPASESEHLVQRFAGAPCRHGVVLRLGLMLGDSPLTRWSVSAAERGRPVALGDPDGYLHLVHSADVGPAVEAALAAPSGTYNVGAVPVRRREVLATLADATGVPLCRQLGPLRVRWAGQRAEPLGRSLRVSSEAFRTQLGWRPRHDQVDLGWFEAALRLPRLSLR